ncbi:MAG: guanylate kinase [Thermovirgaceae bacterium]
MAKKVPEGTLFVISGPSGVGKGTLRKELFRRIGDLSYSVSCTTREPRTDEREGVDYFFLDGKTFDRLLERGAFLEWAEVHGNLYGTLEETVRSSLREGKDVILEIDVQGAMQVKNRMPEAVLIFISPPGEGELIRRLSRRGTEQEQERRKRLENARKELDAAPSYDHIVINDDIERAAKELADIVRSCRNQKTDTPFAKR